MDAKAPALDKKKIEHGTLETAGKIAGVVLDFDRLKDRMEHAFEDVMYDARRAAKTGRRRVDDIIEDTTHLIKKNPWRSVGYVLATGVGVGMVASWLLRKKSNCRSDR